MTPVLVVVTEKPARKFVPSTVKVPVPLRATWVGVTLVIVGFG